MAEAKSSKAKNDSDSQKTGSSCGFSLGCLIIVITVAAVIFFLFVKPMLEEHGYSLDDLEEKVLDLKDKTHETIERTRDAYQESKDKLEDVKAQADEKVEEIKDKAGEGIDKINDIDDQTRENVNKAAPRLIEG
jgi:uncharacterized protein YoxC